MRMITQNYGQTVIGRFKDGRAGISYVGIAPPGDIPEYLDNFAFKVIYKTDGVRPVYKTQYDFKLIETHSESGKELRVYSDGNLRISAEFLFTADGRVIRTRCQAVNIGDKEILLEKLTSVSVGGIGGNAALTAEEINDLEIVTVKNCWCGEGRAVTLSAENAGLTQIASYDSRAVFRIRNEGTQTTSEYFPLAFILNKRLGAAWFIQFEPAASWNMNFMLAGAPDKDRMFFCAETYSGSRAESGWQMRLKPGESYCTPYTAFGAASGGVNEAVKELTGYRRANKKASEVGIPVVFNDYMNCHWSRPDIVRTPPLIRAAAKAGAEIFCLDAGWYKENFETWFGELGEWLPSPTLFGEKGLSGIIELIHAEGMHAGLWLEIECCTPETAQKFPEDWFLSADGSLIFDSGRYFFDFTNSEVCDYLKGCIRRLYGMGVRYFKNDYNASAGLVCDINGKANASGMERQYHAIRDFFSEIARELPDVIWENCGSGAMREDNYLLSAFDLQSVSDNSDYYRYPSIINGTLLNILPEQAGIWCMVWPQYYKDSENEDFDREYNVTMLDGEETVFNIVNAFCGVMYLSGRIDRADEMNFRLLRDGVTLYKSLRNEIAAASALFPLPFSSASTEAVKSQGLKLADGSILLAVFRQGGEDNCLIPMKGIKKAEKLFPPKYFDDSTVFRTEENGLSVTFTRKYQARLFKITV